MRVFPRCRGIESSACPGLPIAGMGPPRPRDAPLTRARKASMAAYGSLGTLGVAELLQIAALFRKVGFVRLDFAGGRTIVVYVQDGNLSGVTDTGRVWQLGELVASMGLLGETDKRRLLALSHERGVRLGQLLLEEGLLSRHEMERVLRRLMLQSLLYAVEHEEEGEFLLQLSAVYGTSVTFPIHDFLIEITSCIDELQRLRAVLGPGAGPVTIEPGLDLADTLRALSYRQVQVLAHVDGEKTPTEVTAAVPFTPTESLRILADLAQMGVVVWVRWAGSRPMLPLGRVVPFPAPARDSTTSASG